MKLPSCFHAPLSRERDRIRAEMYGIQGLLPLLMKQRNGSRWTPTERAQLQAHLRSVTTLSPYLLVVLAPGSFALFPLLAWWLDRRRQARSSQDRVAAEALQALTEKGRSSSSPNP